MRLSCCRFYFVGDEDLLEIIGNSKNLPRLQKHFKKMFAGVHSIILDDDCTQVINLNIHLFTFGCNSLLSSPLCILYLL